MNYTKHYKLLIEKHGISVKPKEGYYECHHIIPRAHGGTDDKDNLVWLTARCHYLAHWLLVKIYRTPAMIHAFHLMSTCKKYNSKGFELAKRQKAELMKRVNPMFDRSIAKKQGLKLIKESRKERMPGKDQSRNRSESLVGNERNAKKTYLVTLPDKSSVVITNMRKFCRENNLNQTCMVRVCKGKLDNHFGYKATYITGNV